jgi:hypothetical protein
VKPYGDLRNRNIIARRILGFCAAHLLGYYVVLFLGYYDDKFLGFPAIDIDPQLPGEPQSWVLYFCRRIVADFVYVSVAREEETASK